MNTLERNQLLICLFPWILWSDLGQKDRYEVFEIARWKRSGVSVQKLIAATKPTKLAYEILIKNSTSPLKLVAWNVSRLQKESRN